MTLYLDCEFNSFGGELISIALVPESEFLPFFYQAIAIPPEVVIDPWVEVHVMTILNKKPNPLCIVQERLEEYLSKWPDVHIIADWPEDIAYFCKLVITGPGMRIKLPKLTFEIVTIDAPSQLPHNALADAIGIRDAHKK